MRLPIYMKIYQIALTFLGNCVTRALKNVVVVVACLIQLINLINLTIIFMLILT